MPSSAWRSLLVWLSSLEGPRKLVINGLVVIVTVLGAVVVGKAAWQQVYVIEPISLPKDLEARGYTPVSVGQRIIDAVTEINRTAAMTKQTGIYTLSEADPRDRDATDFQTPGRTHLESSFALSSNEASRKYDVSVGGVSLTTIVLYIRELFGWSDTKISGEIIAVSRPVIGTAGKDERPAPTKFSIRLRVTDREVIQHEGEATDELDTLFERAALKVVERFDPLQAAYYSYYKQDYENALRIALAYLVDETKHDKQLASNVLGLVRHAQYRYNEARVRTGYENAIAAFTEATKRDPQFTPGLYNLAYVLIDKGLKEHDDEAAHRLFSQAHELALKGVHIDEARDKPNRALAVGYATAGSALRNMARGDPAKYDEAILYFDRSSKADPMFIYAYLSQGSIYNCRKAPEKANDQYQLATELNPTVQTFTRVGALLRHFHQDADAVPMFQRAAELKPTSYAYTYWGMAARDSGQHDEAAKLFEKAIAADPKVPNGYNQLGLMYLSQEKWDKAAEKFEQAIEANPIWSNYYYNLGRAFRGAGKFDQAIAAFDKAIAIYQDHASSYKELGELQELGKVTEETARKVEEKSNTAVRISRNSEERSCTSAAISLSMSSAWNTSVPSDVP